MKAAKVKYREFSPDNRQNETSKALHLTGRDTEFESEEKG
jgi:hypothetical protein